MNHSSSCAHIAHALGMGCKVTVCDRVAMLQERPVEVRVSGRLSSGDATHCCHLVAAIMSLASLDVPPLPLETDPTLC